MLLSQSLRQVCKNQGAVAKWFPFHKGEENAFVYQKKLPWYWWKANKDKLVKQNYFTVCSHRQKYDSCHHGPWAVMDHLVGTAWNGHRRDFTAADRQVLNLYSQNIPLRAEVISQDLHLRVIFSKIPTSIQGIFLQLHICLLLSLSFLWCALAGL